MVPVAVVADVSEKESILQTLRENLYWIRRKCFALHSLAQFVDLFRYELVHAYQEV